MQDGADAGDPDGERSQQKPEAGHIQNRERERDQRVDPVTDINPEDQDQAGAYQRGQANRFDHRRRQPAQ